MYMNSTTPGALASAPPQIAAAASTLPTSITTNTRLIFSIALSLSTGDPRRMNFRSLGRRGTIGVSLKRPVNVGRSDVR